MKRLDLNPSQWLALLGVLMAAAVFLGWVGSLNPQTSQVAGLVMLLVVLLATNAIPPFLSVLVFFALAMVFRVVPPDLAFSGFTSGAFWLVFGGLVIGAAVRHTGLANRIANRMVRRFQGSYVQVIGGVVLLGIGLSFLVPSSMGRVVLLVPIVIALADGCGFGAQSKGRYGIILATVYSTHLPAFTIMPASVPNMLLVGTIEAVWGEVVQYGAYLLLHFPVLGALKAVAIFGLIVALFGEALPTQAGAATADDEAVSPAEWRLAVVMVGVLGLWVTDFLHGIAPAWVALSAGVVLLLPGVGVLPTDTFNTRISYTTLIYTAGIIALGSIIAESELSAIIAAQAERWLPLMPDRNLLNFTAITLTAMLIALFATVPTVPAVMVPLSGTLADLSGLPLMSVLMMQVVGFSTVFFPYQAAPLLVGVLLGEVPMGQAIRFTLALAAVTLVILLPLNYLWWVLLGRL